MAELMARIGGLGICGPTTILRPVRNRGTAIGKIRRSSEPKESLVAWKFAKRSKSTGSLEKRPPRTRTPLYGRRFFATSFETRYMERPMGICAVDKTVYVYTPFYIPHQIPQAIAKGNHGRTFVVLPEITEGFDAS